MTRSNEEILFAELKVHKSAKVFDFFFTTIGSSIMRLGEKMAVSHSKPSIDLFLKIFLISDRVPTLKSQVMKRLFEKFVNVID